MARSSGQPMECEAALTRLLDLVYDELDASEVSAVRAHVEDCDGCTRALARLEGGRALARKMEVVEPPSSVLDAVRAAARSRAAEAEREAPPVPREVPREETPAARRTEPRGEPARAWWSDLFRWLGSMAMGPQVAMATLLLLMIGIGLWSIPTLRGPGVPTTAAVVEPDTVGEAGPSAGGLQPAEPLAFDFDPRTRRLAPIDEDGTPAAIAPAVRPASTPERRASVPIERAEDPASAATVAQAEVPERRPERAPEEPSVAADDEAQLAIAGVEGTVAPGDSVGAVVSEALPPVREERVPATSAPASVERTVTTPIAPIAPSPEPRSRQAYRGSGEEAPPRATLDTDTPLVARALHRQAQADAARGAYAECVRRLGELTARYPGYDQSGAALLDLAQCQQRMGRLGEAARTLQRAQRHETVRPEAERRLAAVRMAEREAERAVSEPAAASAAEPTSD